MSKVSFMRKDERISRGEPRPTLASLDGQGRERGLPPMLSRTLVDALLVLGAFTWIAGISLPVIRVTQFFVFVDEVTLIGAVHSLFMQGETVVGVIVFLFSVVLPGVKLAVAGWAWRIAHPHRDSASRSLAFLDVLGKWSMLDVLVIALLLVVVKTSWVAEAETRTGFYCFAVSAILAMLASVRIKQVFTRARARKDTGSADVRDTDAVDR